MRDVPYLTPRRALALGIAILVALAASAYGADAVTTPDADKADTIKACVGEHGYVRVLLEAWIVQAARGNTDVEQRR